jgi:hypothetical protein
VVPAIGAVRIAGTFALRAVKAFIRNELYGKPTPIHLRRTVKSRTR